MSGILMMSVGNSYGSLPINTVAPVVSGTVQVGQTLSCSTGTWTAAPAITGYTYQWQRSGSNIGGATSNTYAVQVTDVGSTLRCVVTATNALGSVVANSNSTGTVPAVTGQATYTTGGVFEFIVPAGVTSVSMVLVGAGGRGHPSTGSQPTGGGGGGLTYLNNYAVTPGQSLWFEIGNGGIGNVNTNFKLSEFGSAFRSAGAGGQGQSSPPGGTGGTGLHGTGGNSTGSGGLSQSGGGAAGYAGNGGSASGVLGYSAVRDGTGGGGGAGYTGSPPDYYTPFGAAGLSGGVGLLGQGASGAGGTSYGANGGAGSGGTVGGFGSGGRGPTGNGDYATNGGTGAVRIIWPGTTRQYPSTNTGDL
jgi:hypothetical protein